MGFRPAGLILVAAILQGGCGVERSDPPEGDFPPVADEGAPVTEPEAPAPSLDLASAGRTLRSLLTGGAAPDWPLPVPSTVERAELRRLYGETEALLWLRLDGSPRRVADDALTVLLDAASEGLQPESYGASALDSLARQLGSDPDPGAAARFDAGLSAAILRYLRHLHSGRVDPRRIGFLMDLPAERHDLPALLATALADGTVLETVRDLAPPLAQYRLLRQALRHYRALAARAEQDGEEPVALARTVEPGDTVAGLSSLARRLVATGDLDQLTGDTIALGPSLTAAVRRFQARHGLEPDGVVGRGTLEELNRPLGWRVHQIELSLERIRWLPDLSAGPFVLVNIPMFELQAFDGSDPEGAPALRMGVIVGKALDTRTPVFAEEMRYLIFQPYWNVPSSILRNEVLPAWRRDSSWLRKQDMEIVQGPGDDALPLAQTPANMARLAAGQLRVRQRPGTGNALGQVKFMFPNDQQVYLHGTPAQELFSRARRDFSHGCVRVEDPPALARFVLRDQPAWTADAIREAMTSGPVSRRVDLGRPLPVLLYYTTAAAEADGVIRFARDIYGHDTRLDAALHSGRAGG